VSITRRASTRLFTVRSHLRLSDGTAAVAQGGGGGGGEGGGGGDLIRINSASPHRPAVLLIHERDERKVGRERVIEGGEHLKPRAGPSLEVFRVMFLLSLTITFLLPLTPSLPLSLTSFEGGTHAALKLLRIYHQPSSFSLKLLFDPCFLFFYFLKVAQMCISVFLEFES